MFTLFMVLTIFGVVTAENQTELYPNCDLIQTSHVGINRNEDGSVNITYSWDRKSQNYDKLDGPVTQYVVRHGPLVDDQPTNESAIMRVDADKDAVIISHVVPSDKYFIQVCAVTTSYRFLFQNDIWDHAWLGWLSLSVYKPNTESTPTPWPEYDMDIGTGATVPPFDPRCDLVQTSYVSVQTHPSTKSISMQFMWDRKESSYNHIDGFDHYMVRHGPTSRGLIIEDQARYMPVENTTSVFTLSDLPPDVTYGLQICAVNNDDFGIDPSFDWNNNAWTGTLDIGSYESYSIADSDEDTMPPDASDSTDEDTTTPPDGGDADGFSPRCDLVQVSHVSIGNNFNTNTLLVDFGWDKKQESYDEIGEFDHYLVRHGPTSNGYIEEPKVQYLVVDKDATHFTLTDIRPGGTYALQICAITDTATGIELPIDWYQEAWQGGMNLTNLDSYGAWIDPNLNVAVDDSKNSDKNSDTGDQGPAETDTSDSQEIADSPIVDNSVHNEPIFMSKISLGSTYGILLLVLAIVSIVTIVVACTWLVFARNRRNSKIAAGLDDPPTKGMALP